MNIVKAPAGADRPGGRDLVLRLDRTETAPPAEPAAPRFGHIVASRRGGAKDIVAYPGGILT